MINSAAAARGPEAAPESRTRERVLQAISQHGPITTAELATRLGYSDTAVRRHVDNIVEAGLIETHEAQRPRRRRGRPAKAYVVSQAGHRALASDYDDLAMAALSHLDAAYGPDAVAAFARERVATWQERCEELPLLATPAERAEELVAALSKAGYEASLRQVGGGSDAPALTGLQLCQGHCPMQRVAARFPQFCEAETEAFSRVLGVHVQRLATLAQGDHVCTTFIPLPPDSGAAPHTHDNPDHAEAS